MKFTRRQPVVPAETQPLSMQEHIKVVHEIRAAAPAPRRPTGKLVVGGAALAGIIALWQFGPRFGWGTGGKGSGAGQGNSSVGHSSADDSASLTAARQHNQIPQRPLRVTVDGTHYFIDGKEVDLATITDLAARVPAGEGPAIEVKRNGTSRAKAEQELKTAIDKQQLPVTWSPPLE